MFKNIDSNKLETIMYWVVGLSCATFWIWGAVASYQGAGLGGFLLWLVFGSLLCVVLYSIAHFILIKNLSETLKVVLTFAALGVFVWLVQALWGVRF